MKHAEILVVGAGPAGIAAASAAASHGCKVIVLDDNPAPGGQIWRNGIGLQRDERNTRKAKAIAALRASGAVFCSGHRVVDAPSANVLRTVAEIEGRVYSEAFAWERLILATGAREVFLPFPGWTLPGVFGAGGLQALVKSGYAVKEKRILVAGSGPLLLPVAAYLRKAGARIVDVVEQAGYLSLLTFAAGLIAQPEKLWQALEYRAKLIGISYRPGWWPLRAKKSADALLIEITNGHRRQNVACDMLACGFHLTPNTELASLLGCELRGNFVEVDDEQKTSIDDIYCAGESASIAGVDAAMVQGQIAGLSAAGHCLDASRLYKRRNAHIAFSDRLARAFRPREELRSLAAPDTIVCRCEDVTFGQLQRHSSWTDAKLQTRCGMGACQGRICDPIVQVLFSGKPRSIRPPVFPVPISVFSDNKIGQSNKPITP